MSVHTQVSRRVTSYATFAEQFVSDPVLHDDPSFAIRVLRQSVLQARDLVDQTGIDAFHSRPPTTGDVGWDSLLAGVAVMTGTGRTTPGVLDWCAEPGRRSTELFDPLDTGKYRLLEMLRTPIALRERNVILSRGNLEGV
ncbi:hypothetical protein M2359_002758 [Gordonia amarae]|uniref:Uncharacterized protein n=1 Tax=Gordonia amarae NBRC 15530 TaxID=1075090 RepID=G7GJC4_9ACTN|nr:hypothetical protein [Gordonia amarae]MCS3879129.1 hypothetical protein [Gordonia amarae]GAB03699.1 hypothetical protein GOAMR_04_00160 [Gordonia amarae NBRC 15530]